MDKEEIISTLMAQTGLSKKAIETMFPFIEDWCPNSYANPQNQADEELFIMELGQCIVDAIYEYDSGTRLR